MTIIGLLLAFIGSVIGVWAILLAIRLLFNGKDNDDGPDHQGVIR